MESRRIAGLVLELVNGHRKTGIDRMESQRIAGLVLELVNGHRKIGNDRMGKLVERVENHNKMETAVDYSKKEAVVELDNKGNNNGHLEKLQQLVPGLLLL